MPTGNQPTSFRFPFDLEGVDSKIKGAIRYAFTGLKDLNDAIRALNAKTNANAANVTKISTAVSAIAAIPAPTPTPPPSTFILNAGENINAFSAVACVGGLAYNADASTLAHAGRVVGVALTSAITGQSLTIQGTGEADNNGFLFTAGDPVFLGNAGALVQAPAGTIFEQQIGMALSISRLVITLGEVILYA